MKENRTTKTWTAADVPSQGGKLAIVTGPTSGAGVHIALGLAQAGAEVLLAARDLTKANATAERIRSRVPGASVECGTLDLASLESVHAFAADFESRHGRLDILVNNAGIAAVPFGRTADGFEMQFGVNHLGHFALTGILLGKLMAAPAPRVVTVASGAQNRGGINFDTLGDEESYGRYRAYARSKLANMLFAGELQRRADAAGMRLLSVVSQPGYTRTNLGHQGTGAGTLERALIAAGDRLFAHGPEAGALPTLYAATAPDVPGDSYVSPTGFGGLRGAPGLRDPGRAAKDPIAAERLWELSEELTGVSYDLRSVRTASNDLDHIAAASRDANAGEDAHREKA